MLHKLYTFIGHRADELLVTAVVLVGAALYYAPSLMPLLSSEGFLAKGAESTLARDVISKDFTGQSPAVIVILKSSQDYVASDAFKQAATDVVEQIQKEQNVSSVLTFYSTGQSNFVSNDGRSSYLLVGINGTKHEQQEVATRLRDTIKSNQLELAFAGQAILNHDITTQINSDLAVAETVSFLLLAVLLVVVFRGVVAALLPLLLGAFSVLVAMLLLRGLVEFTTIVEYALNVIILIGLGLSVDYSLLMVSRFREELVAQKGNVNRALRTTMLTAGRTVLFSGLTVIISLLALVVFPLDFLRSMGLGGAAAVLVAMSGALVVLPAMLHLLGHRVNWLSFGSARRMHVAAKSGKALQEKQSFWYKAGAWFMRRPAATFIVVLALLLFAGSPFLQAKLSTPDHTVMPPDSQARQATERLQHDFSFTSSPIEVLYISNHDLASSTAAQTFSEYQAHLKKIAGVKDVEVMPGAPASSSALVRVMYNGSAASPEAQEIVKSIRAQNTPDASVRVAGDTAELVDLLHVLLAYIPLALAIVGITLFVLLFLMLGSVVIPIKAMLQNLLSLCVSFGALVWIFQDGNMADILHMNVVGSIDATQPVLIFAVAFGLSMDYSVFLYGRIKEEYDRSGDTNKSVLRGLQKTGTTITSAAVLLFVVVAAFATSRISIMQEIGVGLALAILVDAFLVRMILVPATMRLLGTYNWWAPKFMKRLHAKFGIRD